MLDRGTGLPWKQVPPAPAKSLLPWPTSPPQPHGKSCGKSHPAKLLPNPYPLKTARGIDVWGLWEVKDEGWAREGRQPVRVARCPQGSLQSCCVRKYYPITQTRKCVLGHPTQPSNPHSLPRSRTFSCLSLSDFPPTYVPSPASSSDRDGHEKPQALPTWAQERAGKDRSLGSQESTGSTPSPREAVGYVTAGVEMPLTSSYPVLAMP